jgi:hypothetical protein
VARLDIRLSEQEKQQMESEAASEGISLSELVRRRVLGVQGSGERLEAIERRLDRLEELAGL